MPTLIPTWASDDSVIPDPHGRAERLLRFADILQHPKAVDGETRPLPHRWQRRILQRIYGPSNPDGRRQVKTVFALLPRGARKTTLSGVIALANTIGPFQRPGGQVVSAASDRSQARIAFDEAAEMIRLDERLVAATRVRDTKSRIEHPKSRSVYTAISAEGDAQHGKTPHLVIADELHVWRGYSLWTALSTGVSKVSEGLKVIITTAGERTEGVCWELHAYALRCLANPEKDPSFLPIIYSADPRADWDDEELWHQVNPGLADGFPDLDELRAEARLARELPVLCAGFKQTHLNLWQDGSVNGWIDMAVFDEGAEPVDEDALDGREAWIGVDLSKSYDLTCISVAIPDDEGGFDLLTFPFLPSATLRKRATETDVAWQSWADEGLLTVIDGDLIDDDVIEAKIRELCETFDVREIGFDPKFAGKMMARLAGEGLPAVAVEQRPLIMGPFFNEVQKLLIARRVRHGGHPILRWCLQNAVPVYGDSGLPYLSKKKSTGAIDCIVSGSIALGRATASTGGVSVFSDPDFDPEMMMLEDA